MTGSHIAKAIAIGALALTPMAAWAARVDLVEGLFTAVGAVADRGTRGVQSDLPVRWLDGGNTKSESNSVEVLRSRSVLVDTAGLLAVRDALAEGGPRQVRLNLFSDVEVDARIDRTAETRYGWSLSGRIDGDPHGAVTLVVHGDILAGAVHSQEGTFAIASRNGVIHTVNEVTGDFQCGVDGHAQSAAVQPGAGEVFPTTASDGDNGSEVDLLVLFTQAALDVEGSLGRMRASVDLAVAWTNDAYEASGVDYRVNLVAAVQIDYLESRLTVQGVINQNVDKSRLIDPADGFMDEAHVLRDRYAADVVHLIVDQPGGGGVGTLLLREDPAAAAVSVSNSLTRAASLFAHELGHVMGLLHDRYEEGRRPYGDPSRHLLSPWSYGYVNQRMFDRGASEDSRWTTIMAYNSQCRDEGLGWCRRLQRFSNPNQRYPDDTGDPLGVAGEQVTNALDGPADAVRSLNENSKLVAGFGQSAARCDYRLSEERREVSASAGVLSVEVDADSDCEWTATTFGDFLSVESDTTGSGTGSVSYRVAANDGAARVGYLVVAGETLSVYQSGATAPMSVCDRTPQVRDAIVGATGLDCAAVSEFDLLEVIALDLRNRQIATLEIGDFEGLPKLTELFLSGNPLGTIPERAFRDLANLKALGLRSTVLRAIPGAIRRLPSLHELDLSFNDIEELSQDDLEGLFELRWLRLHDNEIAALPDGVFSDLRSLNYLLLARNRVADVRKEALEGPEGLHELDLSHNPLGRLREDALANLQNVLILRLRDTQLEALPPSIINGLTNIARLDLSDNRIDDLAGVVFPGGNLAELNLANNALGVIPPDIFAGFTSTNCVNGQLVLNLSENPGSPFALSLELVRVDAGHATAGPASLVVRVREGAPWPIGVRVVAMGDSSFTREVTVVNGETESEPFEVAGEDLTRLRFAAAPRVPGSYRGVRMALGDALALFGLDDAVLNAGGKPFRVDLAEAFRREREVPEFSVTSSDAGVATANVANGMLTVTPESVGETNVQLTVSHEDGTTEERAFAVTVDPPRLATTPEVWLFPSVSDSIRQGFARVVNRSDESGEVRIRAFDDAGMRYGPTVLSMERRHTVHFNSNDLESGNEDKGLPEGIGPGEGAWRLSFESGLDIEVLSYIRTTDGFLTSMHDVAPVGADGLRVVTFNPASNVNQVSRLRLVNPGDVDATATITGVDDAGVSPGDGVQVSVPAGKSVLLSSGDLESGSGAEGSLGDGQGKWRLNVDSDQPLAVMSLLENVETGHLTNLSTVPEVSGDGVHRVPLFPSASDASGRQGFVRVVNRSNEWGEVTITAHDGSERTYEPLTLTLESGETVHFNSNDLEVGNAGKGLRGSTGAGTGDWRLVLTSNLQIDVFSYIRTRDGFLTAVHDTVPLGEGAYPVVTLNPGSNVNQVSSLRLINTGAETAEVTIQGVDDAGDWSREVRLSLPAGAVRVFTSAQLETGGNGFEGELGDGMGKWRLTVVSDKPLSVISLLESPTGHVTNLSTAPQGR